jgi:hypothetical protein
MSEQRKKERPSFENGGAYDDDDMISYDDETASINKI